MTPEEVLNKQIWEILQDIKEEILATEEGGNVKYRIPNVVGVGIIPKDRRIKILYKLQELKTLTIQRNADGVRIGSSDTYYLIIHATKFNEIYKQYQELLNPSPVIQPDILKQEKPKLRTLAETSNYTNVPAKIAVTDLQSKYQEIETEKDLVQFYIKIAHYGQYVLENAATMYVLESLYKEAENDAKPYILAWEKFYQEWKILAKDILKQAKKVGITDDNPLSNEIADIANKLQRNETSLWESDISNHYTSYWYLIKKFNDLGKSSLLIPKHFASSESPLTIANTYNDARNEWDKFKHSREAKVWWAHYQVCRLAAGILDLKERENYFKDDNAIDGFYKYEFEELSKGNSSHYPIVLHADKYRVWIKRLHEYLVPRLQNVDMNWVIATFRKKMYLEDEQKNLEETSWSDKFKWINENDFYLDENHTISFGAKSSDRKTVFQMLADAKGEWVKVSDMAKEINKSHARTRTILAQINEDKLKKTRIILIVPKSDTNEPGAYRIKLISQN